MSYLITDKRYTECFKEHKATLKILNDDTQTLEWKEPGTRNYQIDYVFHKNMLFVSGDLGEASFSCTWCPKWDTDNGWLLSLDYLFEKLSAIRNGKYNWTSEDAVEDLKDHYREMFDELDDEEFEEMSTYIIKEAEKHWYSTHYVDCNDEEIPHKDIADDDYLLQYCIAIKHAGNSSNESEFVYTLNTDEQFKDFNDFWEWGYRCGRRMNTSINYYLAGLQMAYAQLKEQAYENQELLEEDK